MCGYAHTCARTHHRGQEKVLDPLDGVPGGSEQCDKGAGSQTPDPFHTQLVSHLPSPLWFFEAGSHLPSLALTCYEDNGDLEFLILLPLSTSAGITWGASVSNT